MNQISIIGFLTALDSLNVGSYSFTRIRVCKTCSWKFFSSSNLLRIQTFFFIRKENKITSNKQPFLVESKNVYFISKIYFPYIQINGSI